MPDQIAHKDVLLQLESLFSVIGEHDCHWLRLVFLYLENGGRVYCLGQSGLESQARVARQLHFDCALYPVAHDPIRFDLELDLDRQGVPTLSFVRLPV